MLPVLRRFEFEVIRAENCPFPEQVRLARRARYLVSNHGAGLTNMLFMEPGASVLELRHAADAASNCYFALSSQLGLSYFYQTCEPAVPGEHPHTADVSVDVRRLEGNLERMISAARSKPRPSARG
jgi:capsular polysaccharide biosynthesis protein